MHSEMPSDGLYSWNNGEGKNKWDPREYDLHPLVRLRQLAEEIRGAAGRNDLEVVCQAANLLAPALEQCKDVRDRLTDSAGEAAQIAMQTQNILNDCESVLTIAMRGIAVEMRRIQQGKRVLKLARRRAAGASARSLDAKR